MACAVPPHPSGWGGAWATFVTCWRCPCPRPFCPPRTTGPGEEKAGSVSVCRGSLIVHKDGTPLLCSEELAGRSCAGDRSYERHRIFRSCGLTLLDGCPECEAQAASRVRDL